MKTCDRCPDKRPTVVVFQAFVENENSMDNGLGCSTPVELCEVCAEKVRAILQFRWNQYVPFDVRDDNAKVSTG